MKASQAVTCMLMFALSLGITYILYSFPVKSNSDKFQISVISCESCKQLLEEHLRAQRLETEKHAEQGPFSSKKAESGAPNSTIAVNVSPEPTVAKIGYGEATDPEGLEYDVTFCSQGTLSRWGFMLEIARRWKGPMSIVYFFPAENLTDYEELRATSDLRENMIISYMLEENTDIFPINTLRNKAIDQVQTTHFWLSDMDVWPTMHTYNVIKALPREWFQNEKNLGIVPVFQNKKLYKCATFQDCIDLYDDVDEC